MTVTIQSAQYHCAEFGVDLILSLQNGNITLLYFCLCPWMKVIIQSMLQSELPQSMIVPSLATVALMLCSTFNLNHAILDLSEGHHTKYALKHLSAKYNCAKLVTVASIVFFLENE